MSKLEHTIKEVLGVQWVGQDRFHVAHSLSPKFNNMHPQYTELIINGWRNCTVVRDGHCERRVDEMLLNGRLTKSCTFRHLKLRIRPPSTDEQEMGSRSCMWRLGAGEWEAVDADVLQRWKTNGAYHELFSTSPDVVVPEHVLDKDVLQISVRRHKDHVIDTCFEQPPLDGGRRMPKLIGKQKLALDAGNVDKFFENALARIKNCCPPPGLDDWYLNGETDQNDLSIWQPYSTRAAQRTGTRSRRAS